MKDKGHSIFIFFEGRSLKFKEWCFWSLKKKKKD